MDDLSQEVGPDELRAALRTAARDLNNETHLLPCQLTDVQHPVVDKANIVATDDASPRERIETLTDRYAIKVKTGDRRAALWQDGDKVWWLLAAGRRKDDGPGDFYRELERFTRDSTPIAPTEGDRRYSRFEAAYIAECQTERTAQGRILQALLAAANSPQSAVDVEVFGATVSIVVEPDEEGLAVVEVSWKLTRFDEQDRFPMDILAMVPGRENIELWDYLPPRMGTEWPHTWFTYVPQGWVDHLATSAELDDLLGDGDGSAPVNPVSDGSEHFSHLAKGSIVTLAYMTGIEIVGLCGARVVAHRDYEKFPVCPDCEENLTLLRKLKTPGKA